MISFQPKVIPDHHSPHDVRKVINALNDKGEYGQALALIKEALNRFPNNEHIFLDFCLALERCGMEVDALHGLRQGLRKNPKSSMLHGTLVEMLFRVGESSAMLDELEKFLIKVNHGAIPRSDRLNIEVALSNISLLSLYRDDISDQEKWKIHKATGDAILQQSAMKPIKKTSFNPKPRIGLLSNQINQHAVGKFSIPLLKCIDFGKYDLYVYFDTETSNEAAYNDSVAALSDTPIYFRKISGMRIGDSFSLIVNDCIDIMIDLSGRFSGGPTNLLALKPAPIQVSWIGYPTHPGLKTIDFMLSDRYCEPRTDLSQGDGVGKVYHFDRFFSCFEGPREALSPHPPSASNGYITFGSFNNIDKISSSTLAVWAKTMKLVPGSNLLLKFYEYRAHQKKKIIDDFEKLGVNKSRLFFVDKAKDEASHLRLYDKVDIALDTFPYNGTTTTCEAIWMGVPVVTKLGASHLSRVSAGILKTIGCEELIGSDSDGFVSLAVGLAKNTDRLNFYKKNLRVMMENSELCDARSMAKHFEKFVNFSSDWLVRRNLEKIG
jgi:protein O-GlcNAc transferase